MTANDTKSYLSYLDTMILTIILLIKKTLLLIILLWLKNIEANLKAHKCKVNDRVTENYTENWTREIFIIDSVLKTNLST